MCDCRAHRHQAIAWALGGAVLQSGWALHPLLPVMLAAGQALRPWEVTRRHLPPAPCPRAAWAPTALAGPEDARVAELGPRQQQDLAINQGAAGTWPDSGPSPGLSPSLAPSCRPFPEVRFCLFLEGAGGVACPSPRRQLQAPHPPGRTGLERLPEQERKLSPRRAKAHAQLPVRQPQAGPGAQELTSPTARPRLGPTDVMVS